jgi:aldehyde dehydrogenase (NAD+)
MSATATDLGIQETLKTLGIEAVNRGASTGGYWFNTRGTQIDSVSPVDGKIIASVSSATEAEYEAIVLKAQEAYKYWRMVPAPKRGEVIRQLAEKIREKKQALGELVSYEMGKSLQEGLGEVQEMIDICDFAVGLSRQLYGLTMHSERAGHCMYE